MDDKGRLPIQVVIPRKTDYSNNKSGGGGKELEPFTDKIKEQINKTVSKFANFLYNLPLKTFLIYRV